MSSNLRSLALLSPANRLRSLLALFLFVAALVPAAYAQVTFSGVPKQIDTGFNYPFATAVDAKGDVFVADTYNGQVIEERFNGTGYSPTTIASGLGYVTGIALDPQGFLYISDFTNHKILEEVPDVSGAYSNLTVIYTDPTMSPEGLAVNIYSQLIATDLNGRIMMFYVSGGNWVHQTLIAGLADPEAVAVDKASNLYVIQFNTPYVVKETFNAGSYSPTHVGSGFSYPGGVTVDLSGDLFVSDGGNHQVVEEKPAASGYTQNVLVNSLARPAGMAVDTSGDLFVTTTDDGSISRFSLWAQTLPSTALGSTSSTLSLPFIVQAGTTIGSDAILSEGSIGSDFAGLVSSTCTTGTYATTTNCKVDVAFSPAYPGIRAGGVVLRDGAGSALASVLLNGIATGSQAAFSGAPQSTIGVGFGGPDNTATDGAGNLYVADTGSHNVYKVTPNGVQTIVGSNFAAPFGVAVDGVGNVYVADYTGHAVYQVTPTGVQTKIGANYDAPTSVTVDQMGNVYVADSVQLKVFKITPGGVQTTLGSNWTGPSGVAVDATGYIYVADLYGGHVYKLNPDGSTTNVSYAVASPESVSVDAGGNVYIASYTDGKVYQFTPTGIKNTIASFTSALFGASIDSAGNLYVTQQDVSTVTKVDRVDLPAVNFLTATPGGATDATDGVQTATIQSIGNEGLSILAVKYPTDFPESTAGNTTDCAAGQVVAPSDTCTLSISFEPSKISGANTTVPISESISLLSNNLSPVGVPQLVKVIGTETKYASSIALTSATNPAPVGASVLFTAKIISKMPIPTGKVQFFIGTTLNSTVALTGGVASVHIPFTSNVGSASIRAVYSGDAPHAAATSPTLAETTSKGTPVVALSSLTTGEPLGSGSKFTASITVNGVPATGTVAFYSDGVSLGTAAVSSGVANYTTTVLTVGIHNIYASYQGDVNYVAAKSATMQHSIYQGLVNGTLKSTAATVTVGTSIGFTSNFVAPNPGPALTGTVSLVEDSTQLLATTPLVNGFASFSINSLQVGQHTITAAYYGDANFVGVNTPGLPETITKSASVVTLISGANPAKPLTSITFSATVATSLPGVLPTGNVSFYSSNTLLGTAALAQGKASLAAATLLPGTHSITASYVGDANYAAGKSSALTETISHSTPLVTLVPSANPAALGATLTLTATVPTTTGIAAPTGMVAIFIDGVSVSSAALAANKTVYSTSTLTHGAHSIQARYAGDANYNAFNSATLTETIQ